MSDPNCFEMSASLRRTMSLCAPVSLLSLMDQEDLPAFQEALKISDPNMWLEPQLASILDLACKKDRSGDFVRELLKANADPNKINAVRKKAPIHFAAESGNVEALEALLNDSRTDVNLKDGNGNTVLHILAKQPYSPIIDTCIKLLLENMELRVNKTNIQGKTAVYFAARQGKEGKETVRILLESGRINVDDDVTYNDETARSVVMKTMPEMEPLLPEKGNNKKDDDPSTKLFHLLYYRKEPDFIRILDDLLKNNEEKDLLNYNNGYCTLLQYAISNRLLKVTKELLERGADPSLTGPYKTNLPSIMAVHEGYYSVVELLYEKDAKFSSKSDGNIALHALIEGAEQRSSKDSHYQIFDHIIPKLLKENKIDINATDQKGNSALHIAARYGDKHFILGLLEHGAYVGTLNKFGDPPLENISSDILEEFLNSCVTTNDKSPRDDNYEIIFTYKFLSPPASFAETPNHSVSLLLDDPPEEPVPECEPLLYISRTPDLRQLLKHPIFTSFLSLKWLGIRPFFFINLIFYTVFVALMTIYILILYEYTPDTEGVSHGDSIVSEHNELINKTNLTNNNGSTEKSSNVQNCIWSPGDAIWVLLVLYFFCLVIRELFQFVVSPIHYIRSPENYLELLLIISSGLVLFYRCADSTTRPHLSATTILLSWAELVLLIGRHPKLSTNIEMLKTVSMNFLQFLAWYSILIVAFALSFYTLFRRSSEDDNFFLEPGTSFFKTVVMVTGEFDAGDLPFQYFPVTSHVVFVLFVFLVAIVLFNLLNGLAVSDTQAIKDDAELVGIVSRIKLISYTESVLLGHPFWCRRRAELECCCCQALNFIRRLSFTRIPVLINKVRLFPNIIPNKIIHVLPNQFCRIRFALPEEDERKLNKNDLCYKGYHCYGEYSLDSRIMKEAVNVLNQRNHPSESEKMQRLLKVLEIVESNQEAFGRHSYKVQYLEEKIMAIEKSCYKTQKALEDILKIMQKSPEDPLLS